MNDYSFNDNHKMIPNNFNSVSNAAMYLVIGNIKFNQPGVKTTIKYNFLEKRVHIKMHNIFKVKQFLW